VTFYNGTTLLGADATPPTPYSMVWSNIAAGSYALSAVAWDSCVPGDSRTSTPVNVQVWSDIHIGSNAVDGVTGYGMATYTLNGNGAGIGTNADDCRLLSMPLSSICYLRARVVSCISTSPLARAGIMIRNSTNANDFETSVLFAPQTNWMYSYSRTDTGGNTVTQGALAAALPYWVAITQGGTFTNYIISPFMSRDGINWVRVGGALTFTNWSVDNVLGGLTVTSGSTNGAISATFDNVSVTWCSTNGLSWTDMHIGSSTGDSAASLSPTYTVGGGGVGLCTNADSFRFVYVPVTGSCSIVARVVSCSGSTATLARAGVMMRESTNANSIEVSTLFWVPSNSVFQSKRTTTGGNTGLGSGAAPAATLPYWVKLMRGGSASVTNCYLASFMSSNGTTWVWAGNSVIFTNWRGSTSLLTGLAVTSGSTNNTLTATFDNVSITRP
jgi:hypothetical protein